MMYELATEFKTILGGMIYGIFQLAVDVLQTLVIALGAGLGIWGVINLWKVTARTTLPNAHVR